MCVINAAIVFFVIAAHQAISPLYLPHISPISPLHLPYVFFVIAAHQAIGPSPQPLP